MPTIVASINWQLLYAVLTTNIKISDAYNRNVYARIYL